MIARMRTTVTLEPDVEALLRKAMRERGISFKDALNQAVRVGLSRPASREYRLPFTARMGFRPDVALDKAHTLAGALEDEELVRKLNSRK